MKQLIQTAKRITGNWLKSQFGFTVVVFWGRKCSVHYSWTLADALEWMRQYPYDGVTIGLYAANGHLLAQRSGK